ncbi:MAG: transcription termination factor NusA [Candidatus Magasanikbacteria bacterium RIFOXYC2_FULL_40_16]|uniref:Transcription termination/antitermination protein NusA n=3 Tax=Candidatus Magasanikiibacteriota TaxID=1752731 RepID=A0A1F6NJ99_9BACT|nr:MAG: transcription termination factor NusA [Candidatus Magasanikbacteria bacterium RIFOXYB1_FULL_40_15]OGH87033.1 MAG: transcription termination factor NusA [Candidatus Magasanikbacteria bacterium RIFOXYB2_FULL_40_13]OGH87319.1 MAG: transcription termination factor NusA [Candidatus Magasanikbacteria bacterium RIFOXYA1_FULL_40_8]OGH90311.1 MAG: transcription termination factor NusA [Candidatus Magasanikbacteria bacterium RIFOXYC2_FULL_40_16]
MSEISKSIQIICDEKGLNYETVIEAVESALAAAYRKDFGNRQQNIKVKFDVETGKIQAWDVKEVVEDIDEEKLTADQEELSKRREQAREEERELTEEETADLAQFNPKTQMMLKNAKEHDKKVKVGATLEIVLEVPGDFGRMAAQTAKQVIMQKLREAERNTVFEDFKGQEGKIVQGTVQRRDRNGSFLIELGKITGILPVEDQIQKEFYRPGGRMKFYVKSVEMGNRGPEIILSRASKSMIEEIFRQEIPEIEDGTVVIEDIARDPGNRSKISVSTGDESIDPIGSCIGQRGSRIITIIEELGGEKIDVIQFSKDAKEYIKQALSPAKISSVNINEDTKEAVAMVEADQFSLAIGRGGQNVRLAADLTGWTIKVVQSDKKDVVVSSEEAPEAVEEKLGETKLDTEEVEETPKAETEKVE